MKTKFELIREWAEKKGIYEKGDVKTQYVKLQEEAGELAKAIMKDDYEEFVDAIGDCVVVLTNLAELGNKYFETQEGYYEDVVGDGGSRMYFPSTEITIESCIDSAYDIIKNRTGKMENGTFKKDEQTNKIHILQKHKNGYYNLPCKWSELSVFMQTNDIVIGKLTYKEKDNLHLIARPSKNGGCAYIYINDL